MVRVIVVGLGPIGAGVARAVLAEAGLELVGLVDQDLSKWGMTAGDFLMAPDDVGLEKDQGPRVQDDLEAVLRAGADVAVVTTDSRFEQVAPLLKQLLKHETAVVSSCEPLVWPWLRSPEAAADLEAAAREAGRAVLGTGVNPGFVMDVLPVMLSTMVRRVSAVRCRRRVDAAVRRAPLQAKIGATLSEEEFRRQSEAGELGHAGLRESLALVAAGLGRRVEPGTMDHSLEPVLATSATPSARGLIPVGAVAGIHQVASWEGADLGVELDLTMAVGLDKPADQVVLEGPVRVNVKVPGALPGDSATVAALVNHIRPVHQAPAGLRTMLDIPPAGCANNRGGVRVGADGGTEG